MGIRFEKDTILNWINEMGKFLRLLVDKWENFEQPSAPVDIASGYTEFFKENRDYFLNLDKEGLRAFIATLEPEQIRPLAQLLMYDGLLSKDRGLLEKARFLLELHMQQSGSFAFEDYSFLAKIDEALR
ncbi:MAG TPA: hypothetical protein PKA53_06870 [Sphingobacterium sp.]|nr:hypothetical protein [Sphingobacterium sp.]